MSKDSRMVLDLETQKAFDQVEGRQPSLLKVSLVGVYQYETNQYRAFLENEMEALEQLLLQSELLIGFNIRRFDMEVLSPYFKTPSNQFPLLDLLEEVQRVLGHRLSLNALATATLHSGKSGSGLDALRYFHEGRWEELTAYCLQDVKVTKELYEYGLRHNEVKYQARDTGVMMTCPINWNLSQKKIAGIIETAFKRRLRVELTYVSGGNGGRTERTQRAVDIYHFDGRELEGYCHLRQGVRHFRVDRIQEARPTFMTYQIPADYHPTATHR
jgi:hypothetical protein